MFYVYVLFSVALQKFYTGYTSNLDKRIIHHNLGLDRWSKRGIPWKLIYYETYKTKTEAIKREKYLKTGKGREFVEARVAKSVKAPV